MATDVISEAITIILARTNEKLQSTVPGAKFILQYIKNSYQDDPFRAFLELLLLFFAVKYLTTKKFDPNRQNIQLTEKVVKGRNDYLLFIGN